MFKEDETLVKYLVGLCEVIDRQEENSFNDFAPKEKVDYSSMTQTELIGRLQSAVCKLLNFKQMVSVTDVFEVASEAEKLENSMRQREADVRKHLQSQYQLRVVLDDRKWDLEKLECKEGQHKTIRNKLEERLNFLKIPKSQNEAKIKEEMDRKLSDLNGIIQGKQEKIERVNKENERLKEQLEEKASELVILKKEKKRMDNIALLMKRSPETVNSEDLQPGFECSIFLSPMIDKVEKKREQLQPRHKRNSTGGEFDLKSTFESLFPKKPVFIKQEVKIVKKAVEKTFRRSLFHDRAYTKAETSS